MPYVISILPEAQRALAKLPRDALRRVTAGIDKLAQNPKPH
jgi:mRNA-degrading endonuclease RelE of RelBE toxin-antitoxin system